MVQSGHLRSRMMVRGFAIGVNGGDISHDQPHLRVYRGGGVTNTETGEDFTTYQNHYSSTFNKCFVLEIVTTVNTKTKNHYTSTIETFRGREAAEEQWRYATDPARRSPSRTIYKDARVH
jgi:hypothetical protein